VCSDHLRGSSTIEGNEERDVSEEGGKYCLKSVGGYVQVNTNRGKKKCSEEVGLFKLCALQRNCHRRGILVRVGGAVRETVNNHAEQPEKRAVTVSPEECPMRCQKTGGWRLKGGTGERGVRGHGEGRGRGLETRNQEEASNGRRGRGLYVSARLWKKDC